MLNLIIKLKEKTPAGHFNIPLVFCFFTLALVSSSASGSTDLDSMGDDYDIFAPLEGTASQDQNDPIEGLNRFVFAFNQAADTLIIEPVVQCYRFVAPAPIQDNIQNFVRNAQSPIILANNLLQGDFEAAKSTFARFFVNSIAGLGGIVDIAVYSGHGYESEDVGQTLATWGIAEGPYLVLPILGPSTLRDTVGLVGGYLADPLVYAVSDDFMLDFALVAGVDARARNLAVFEGLKSDSLDYYARMRSVYRQARQNQIHDKGDNPQHIINGDDKLGSIFSRLFGIIFSRP